MRSAPVAVPAAAPPPARHPFHEDVQALLTGAVVGALAIVLFKQAGLVPGGTVGLALAMHYLTGADLWLALLLANAPFYVLASLRMGREFTVKTFIAVTLASALTTVLPLGLSIQRIEPWLGAVLGGLLAGIAILVLFRHRASLGGLNILAFYAQEKLGWRAGKVQLALDAFIVMGGGLLTTDAAHIAFSVLAVAALNLVLTVNHRPERYRFT
jgi:uncharacterized membrane-anchored protein YitT (DUF2179 family)